MNNKLRVVVVQAIILVCTTVFYSMESYFNVRFRVRNTLYCKVD